MHFSFANKVITVNYCCSKFSNQDVCVLLYRILMHVYVKAEAVQVKQVQQENAQLLKMIAKTDGRVSTRWDDLFIAGWYEHSFSQ